MLQKPSRTVLVAFFNETLQLQLTKLDDLGNGAAYCQLLDSIYGDMPMHRVQFDSRNSMHMESNFKILQHAFMRHGIAYNFDPTRLMKCRLQDNLEFSQWFYQYWNENPHIADYDPVLRRQKSAASVRPSASPNLSNPGMGQQRVRRVQSISHPALGTYSNAAPQPQASHMSQASHLSQHRGAKPVGLTPVLTPARTPKMAASLSNLGINKGPFGAASSAHQAPGDDSRLALCMQEIRALRDENEVIKRTNDIAVEERDAYYAKLLEVEHCIKCELETFYSKNEASASTADPQDPMIRFIRKLQACVFYSPEGFEANPTPDDEPF